MNNVYTLEHVGIGASRATYEETIRFYEEVFGWHRIKAMPGVLAAFVGDGTGGRLEIFVSDAPPLAHPHHLAFGVAWDDFPILAERLRAAGATMDAPYENHPMGDRLIFFTDPAGNRAQIVGRREPLEP